MTALPLAAPKAPGYVDRTEPLARIEALVPELRRRYGITRVGETTGLDRTGVPTFCAIVPNSPDLIGVYNGKGLTRAGARISAVMEAVERQAATRPKLASMMLPLRDVLQSIDLSPLELTATPEAVVECAMGCDLLSNRLVPVPMALVQFPWPKENRVTQRINTNGLASGNNVAESVYHALAEMIERHVWSLFVVRSEILPRYYRGEGSEDRMLARVLTFPTGNAELDRVHDEMTSCGLVVRVCVLEEEPFACVALVCVVEPESHPPMAHIGLGCSLRPSHAIERAMTEAIQSRVVDVQAAREDILHADGGNGVGQHAKRIDRLPHRRWFFDLPAVSVELSELKDEMSDDLASDIRTMIAQMREGGIRSAVAIELSECADVSVVRICAPDFETTAVDGRLGPIALAQLNPLAS